MMRTKIISYFSLIFTLFLTIPNCGPRSRLVKKKVTIAQTQRHTINMATHIDTISQPPPITIWVHGTRLWRQQIFTTFFDGKPNLKPAFLLDESKYLRKIARTLSQNNPEKFPLDTFFLFGWSGKLDAYERENAAHYLIMQLRTLINEYQKKWGIFPKIRILAHSHGGNVILNIPKIDPSIADDIQIEELVLLACPVQEKTREYINSAMFNRVFVFYSTIDMIQVLAPQMQGESSTYNLLPFSSRRFAPKENIKQVKIKMNNRALLHSEFSALDFLSIISEVIDIVDSWKSIPFFFDSTLSTEFLLSVYPRRKPKRI